MNIEYDYMSSKERQVVSILYLKNSLVRMSLFIQYTYPIGYISYSIARADNSVHSLNIINFSENKVTFGMDLRRALRDIFEKYRFRKLSFTVVVGNPIESSYDKLIERYGGRIVGISKVDVKLIDGKYYDRKLYEILAEDYFSAEKEVLNE